MGLMFTSLIVQIKHAHRLRFSYFLFAFTSLIVQIKPPHLFHVPLTRRLFTSLIVQIKPVLRRTKRTQKKLVYIPHSSDKTNQEIVPICNGIVKFTSLIVQIKLVI